jgi:hypothetical protein
MDVPDIWKAKNRIMVMIIRYIMHCMVFPQKKRFFFTPSSHILTIVALWRSLLSADHSSRATPRNDDTC